MIYHVTAKQTKIGTFMYLRYIHKQI